MIYSSFFEDSRLDPICIYVGQVLLKSACTNFHGSIIFSIMHLYVVRLPFRKKGCHGVKKQEDLGEKVRKKRIIQMIQGSDTTENSQPLNC